MWQHADETPIPPIKHRPATPEAINDLVLHLLQKKPARRPPSAAFVGDELDKVHRSLALDEPTLNDVDE
jgi:hypothetical protein